MPTAAELQSLLTSPNETLNIEYKSWLNLQDNRDRATLAKSAIALANSGGGIIVLGMRAPNDAGGPLESQGPPPRRCTPDDINSAVNRYADPELHCDLAFAVHPVALAEHAFVVVPGGHAVPVMTSRECEGVIAARRCYIRKPGPRSEEPHDSNEWRILMDRCIRAGREDMLDAIRAIVQGRSGSQPEANEANELTAFAADTHRRWEQLVARLPPDDAARFPHGSYEIAAQIRGVPTAPSLGELLRRMDAAGQIRHTGWSPFVRLHRPELAPAPVNGGIEAWLGDENVDRNLRRDPSHCDYWRAYPTGRFYQLRGYDEDGLRQPGTVFDVTLPVWRIGDALLYLGRVADTFAPDWSLIVQCRYRGLHGRNLESLDGSRLFVDGRKCADNEAVLATQFDRAELNDNLVEILLKLLSPLYERFEFFELSQQLVTQELNRLTRGRF